jgi:hypothetical protein
VFLDSQGIAGRSGAPRQGLAGGSGAPRQSEVSRSRTETEMCQ